MAKIEKFENLISWQKAKEMCFYVCKLTQKDDFSKHFSLNNETIKQ